MGPRAAPKPRAPAEPSAPPYALASPLSRSAPRPWPRPASRGRARPEVAPRGTLAPGDGEASLGRPEGPFGVVFATPRGPTVDPSEITVVWNRPLRPLEVADQASKPPVVIKPEVPGHWVWVGTTGVTFTPEGHLPRATEYTVEVPAGTKALDGSAMEKPYVLRFSTVRPQLLTASPTVGSQTSRWSLGHEVPAPLQPADRRGDGGAGTRTSFREGSRTRRSPST